MAGIRTVALVLAVLPLGCHVVLPLSPPDETDRLDIRTPLEAGADDTLGNDNGPDSMAQDGGTDEVQSYSLWVNASISDVPKGYSIKLPLDQAFLTKNMAKGETLRIYYMKPVKREIHRVLDPDSSWSAAKPEIWFATQEVVAANTSDKDYLLEFSSIESVALQDPMQVFLLFDDFSGNALDATRWEAPQVQPTVASGLLTVPATSKVVSKAQFSVNTIWEARLRLSEAKVLHHNYWGAADDLSYQGAWIAFWCNHADEFYETSTVSGPISHVLPAPTTQMHTYSFARVSDQVHFAQDDQPVGVIPGPVGPLKVLVWNDEAGPNQNTSMIYDWARVRYYLVGEPVPFVELPD